MCWLERRRADPAQRARACRAGLLRWLYAQHVAQAHMSPVEDFGVSDTALWEGARFSPVEIEDASVYLSDKGLIEGTTVAERRSLTHAQITGDGIDCVTDWEGNMAEYLLDQRGYGPTYNGPYIHGDAPHANMAWHNGGTVTMNQNSQQVAPGFEELAGAVAEILKQLPCFGLAADDQQDAEEAANDVLAEVTQPQPEPRRVRKAVAALRGFLTPIVATASRAEVQDLAQHGIDKLNHAIGM